MDLRQAVTPKIYHLAQRLIQPDGGRTRPWRPLMKWALFLLLGTQAELLPNEACNEALEVTRVDPAAPSVRELTEGDCQSASQI